MSRKELKKAMKDLEIKQSYILALLVFSYSKIASKKLSKEVLEYMNKNKDIIIKMYFIEKLRAIDISKKLGISKINLREKNLDNFELEIKGKFRETIDIRDYYR